MVMKQVQSLRSFTPVLHGSPCKFTRLILWQLFPKWFLGSSLPGSTWRIYLLRLFGARFGRLCRVKPGLNVSCPWNLVVGDDCWLGESVWLDSLASIRIGNSVCISQGSYLCTGNHDYKSSTFDLRLGPISIDSQVWVGAKSVVAPSTIICEGSVVCMGSVVSGVIHPFSIVRGNPAVFIGCR